MKFYCVVYGKRQHRGLLQDSLKTTVTISEQEFGELFADYHYYGFDKRCNQILFINTDKVYTWLFIELKKITM